MSERAHTGACTVALCGVVHVDWSTKGRGARRIPLPFRAQDGRGAEGARARSFPRGHSFACRPRTQTGDLPCGTVRVRDAPLVSPPPHRMLAGSTKGSHTQPPCLRAPGSAHALSMYPLLVVSSLNCAEAN